jgi:hypothetical protein
MTFYSSVHAALPLYGMQFSSFNEILMYISYELAMATDIMLYANKPSKEHGLSLRLYNSLVIKYVYISVDVFLHE